MWNTCTHSVSLCHKPHLSDSGTWDGLDRPGRLRRLKDRRADSCWCGRERGECLRVGWLGLSAVELSVLHCTQLGSYLLLANNHMQGLCSTTVHERQWVVICVERAGRQGGKGGGEREETVQNELKLQEYKAYYFQSETNSSVCIGDKPPQQSTTGHIKNSIRWRVDKRHTPTFLCLWYRFQWAVRELSL